MSLLSLFGLLYVFVDEQLESPSCCHGCLFWPKSLQIVLSSMDCILCAWFICSFICSSRMVVLSFAVCDMSTFLLTPFCTSYFGIHMSHGGFSADSCYYNLYHQFWLWGLMYSPICSQVLTHAKCVGLEEKSGTSAETLEHIAFLSLLVSRHPNKKPGITGYTFETI